MGLGIGGGALISGGINAIKGIFGGIQAARGRKQMNRLLSNRPQYNISQGYRDAFSTYQKLANSQLPGYDIMKGQIDESGAKTMNYAERGAMGSNQFMSAALQSQDKELDAIKNLGLMSAQWRSQQQQNLAGAQNQYGQLQDQQFQVNKLDPWNIKANMAGSRMQAGGQNLLSGVQGIGENINNYAGTKAMLDVYRKMYPQGGNESSAFGGQSQGTSAYFQPNGLNTTLAQGVQPGSTFNPTNFIKKGNGFY